MSAYLTETDLALSYALYRPKLALQCAQAALSAARHLGRPDLVWRALELLSALS